MILGKFKHIEHCLFFVSSPNLLNLYLKCARSENLPYFDCFKGISTIIGEYLILYLSSKIEAFTN